MPTSPNADRRIVCACPGCDELVEQPADPGVTRLYHSRECRMRARQFRRGGGYSAIEAATVHPSPDLAEPPADTERGSGPARLASLRHRRPRVALALLAAAIVLVGVYLTQRSTGTAGHGLHPSAAGQHSAPPPVRTPAAAVPGSRSSSSTARSGRGHASRSAAKGHLVAATPAPAATPVPATAVSPSPHPSSSKASAQATPKPPAGSTLISFEDGTADGWGAFWGDITGTASTRAAFDGTHCLLLKTSGDRYTAIGTTSHVQGLRPGDEVIYHVWSSGQAGGLRPFVQDGDFNVHFGQSADTPLPSKAGWITLKWMVPSVSSVHAIGMQVTNPGSGNLTLAIDALSWPS
ncbi:MAG TPA: hypothetical protein VMV07_07190 [Streptosporangiaceae bacterium]|nr:hypothetical protein [Streptosporangiaceae bacterium]